MEQEKITELINRYFEGESTTEEEQQLRKYLSDPSAPEQLRRRLGYLTSLTENIPEPSEEFYERLEAVTHTEVTLSPQRRALRHLAAVAAVAVIIAGLWMIFFNQDSPVTRDTYEDPVIAMAEVKSILMTVSGKMNSGVEQLGKVSTITEKREELEGLDRISDIVAVNISRLRYLDRLNPANEEINTD
ncbi:MAG: hypothetical protein KDB91_05530 [Bacteroidales bacterium]|jgi:hypothetical protein|nr:hypothetical protein [Bacteroidales bacterium]NLD64307.1 hypothetical protein [Bacteroidales bacterium]HNT92758.1 hypothetical protein [Bacteroidales bacterium]HOO66294.1 hypothetical protein [Bacteroidales bacterium]HPE22768.1 hypothetical protein [Bacteroidales bacterium]